jgi:UDPglucose 6-dehydrogenase
MNVGWVGLGKLGLPCALALADKGDHHIHGYDIKPDNIMELYSNPFERGLRDLPLSNLILRESIQDVVDATDIIFCAVQTPHNAAYGGENVMPREKKDFDYSYLAEAAKSIAKAAERAQKDITLVVISTALPGSMDEYIKPVLNTHVELVYNPFFIAMGTTVYDFLNPEFVLVGHDGPFIEGLEKLKALYATVHDRPVEVMDIKSAELTKVAYNCFISMKVVFGNTVMEICDKMGANCDSVINGLSLATDRVISPAYMRGGMGDGGSCHPRDNIAMSWLADKLQLSSDPFGFVSEAREDQAMWLARMVRDYADSTEMNIVILGKAYKPESNLPNGSPATLVKNLLDRLGRDSLQVDPYIDGGVAIIEATETPAVFLIGTKHEYWKNMHFPDGSIVIDPFRAYSFHDNITYIPLGVDA